MCYPRNESKTNSHEDERTNPKYVQIKPNNYAEKLSIMIDFLNKNKNKKKNENEASRKLINSWQGFFLGEKKKGGGCGKKKQLVFCRLHENFSAL